MSGVPFGVFMGVFFSFQYGWTSGIFGGLFTGIFFGLIIAAFAAFQSRRARQNPPAFVDETILFEGPANHFVGKEAVGGYAYLTDKQFFFKSHSINVNVHEISIPVSQISEAVRSRTFGIIPNQLQLHLSDGRKEKFVVHGVKDWIDKISAVRERFLNGPQNDERRLFS